MAKSRKGIGGRPLSVDEMCVKKLEEAFLLGCSDKEACFAANISRASLYNHQKRHPEFLDRKAMLKKNPVYQARRAMMELLDSDDAAIRIKASTDTLNRYEGKPKDKVELTGESGGPIETSNVITFVDPRDLDVTDKDA